MSSMPPSAIRYERLLSRLRMRQLALIDALHVHGSLQRAAQLLHMSQPAASQMLREIERMLDLPLYERHARGLRPTVAGHRIAASARTILGALQVMAEELQAAEREAHRPLRVGAIPAAFGLVTAALDRLQQHPWLRLQVQEDEHPALQAGVASGELDVALLRRPDGAVANRRFVPLRSDRMVLAASPRHPAAALERVRWRDLAGSRWQLPPPAFAVRGLLDDRLRRAGIMPVAHPVQVVAPTLLRAVFAAADDVVIPAPWAVVAAFEPGAVAVLKLPLRAPLPPLGALYRADGETPALRELLMLLRDDAAPDRKARRPRPVE